MAVHVQDEHESRKARWAASELEHQGSERRSRGEHGGASNPLSWIDALPMGPAGLVAAVASMLTVIVADRWTEERTTIVMVVLLLTSSVGVVWTGRVLIADGERHGMRIVGGLGVVLLYVLGVLPFTLLFDVDCGMVGGPDGTEVERSEGACSTSEDGTARDGTSGDSTGEEPSSSGDTTVLVAVNDIDRSFLLSVRRASELIGPTPTRGTAGGTDGADGGTVAIDLKKVLKEAQPKTPVGAGLRPEWKPALTPPPLRPRTPKPEESKKGTRCPDWAVFIPGGQLSPSVKIEDLCVGRTEVTVEEYELCVRRTECSRPQEGNKNNACNWGRRGRGDHPINCVKYSDAEAYCSMRSARLPTTQEWDWAAYGGGEERRMYPWGSDAPSCALAVMNRGCGAFKTDSVGSRPLGNRPEGITDMIGNVREWASSLRGRTVDRSFARGGSWASGPAQLGIVDRTLSFERDLPSDEIGFRCVADPTR